MIRSAKRWSPRVTVQHVVAAIIVGLVVYKWQGIYFTYNEPPLWVIAVGIIGCIGLFSRLPTLAWAWWAAGAITLAWSLAPGDTLVASLWELGYLAAFAAGFWRRGYWIAAVLLLGLGLERTLVLSLFGLTHFVSGSIHYVAGAQALAIVPLTYSGFVRPGRVASRVALGILLLASTFLAISSGSRAVFLPLVVLLVMTGIRLSVERRRPVLVIGTLVALGVALAGIDAVIPVHPITMAIGSGASPDAQARAVSEQGPFAQRLRFWDQTFDIVLAHPLGSGTGSYRSVIHTYQKYPMVWSASPHNYYVETVATGGWFRLLILLALLVIPLWRAWRSQHWPWALATAGLWMTLAFDVTSYYPIFMMFAFATLGATHHVSDKRKASIGVATFGANIRSKAQVTIAVFCLLAGTTLAVWWYLPCGGTSCVTERYLGIESRALQQLRSSSKEARQGLLTRLRELYPESIWVLRAEQTYSPSAVDQLAIAREIALRYPYQHPDNYLAWANAALATGDIEEARAAIIAGLEIFPEDRYPYGERRMTPARYQAWIDDANAILASAIEQP